MDQQIELLTTLDPNIISGGNLYNSSLCSAVNDLGREMSIVHTKDIEHYISNNATSKYLIIDSIALSNNSNWSQFTDLHFLIHMWPSNQNYDPRLIELEKQIAQNHSVIHAGRNSANKYESERDHFILEPGLQSAWQTKVSHSNSPNKLISIANINGHKGYIKTAKALIKLMHHEWQWHIYGGVLDQSIYRQLTSIITEHGLGQRIKINGTLDSTLVNKTMCKADLLLHFSDHENNSMIIREAIASNLPFAATPTGDNEYLSTLGIGAYSTNFSIEAIMQSLDKIFTDRTQYDRQVNATQALNIPSWPLVAQEFINFIDS